MRIYLTIALLMLLAACQPGDSALPTVLSLDDIATLTADASTIQTAAEVTDTSTAVPPPTEIPPSLTPARTLPPTFTPTATETSSVPEDASPPTSDVRAAGTIYYLYNGDSIAAVSPDGTRNEIIISLGVGQQIRDITVSPDGLLLAFIAPGAGSGREVYIATLDGAHIQKVSCQGFAYTRYPTWTPDSSALTFFAAPVEGAAGNIFIANIANSAACPQGNDQRMLVTTSGTDIRGMAWSADGETLYYGLGERGLMAWRASTQDAIPVTMPSGFGPDFAPAIHPDGTTLAYLRTMRSPDGIIGGGVVTVDIRAGSPAEPISGRGSYFGANALRWSRQGDQLLLTTPDNVVVYNVNTAAVRRIADTALVQPQAAFSPSGNFVAYTATDASGVPQIFEYDMVSRQTRQLTANPEGSISELIWVAS